MTDFPILDSSYTHSTAEYNRVILDHYGYVEPHLDETDDWCAMPLRLVHDQAADFHLECGPYSFDRADIERLREAIAGYDEATKRRHAKVLPFRRDQPE